MKQVCGHLTVVFQFAWLYLWLLIYFFTFFVAFSAKKFEWCWVEEYNFEAKSTIRPILWFPRPINLQIFCGWAITKISHIHNTAKVIFQEMSPSWTSSKGLICVQFTSRVCGVNSVKVMWKFQSLVDIRLFPAHAMICYKR